MEQKEKEVAKLGAGVGTPQALSPVDRIVQLLKGGASPDSLDKMLDVQMKWDANEARKAYHVAMAEFKADPPEIVKDKSVDYATSKGRTAYKHASLYNASKLINEALSKHGLSASWQTAQNGAISVTCKITHVLGHSESTTLTADSDVTGSKNAIQALGSTITYLERYTLLALTGLATTEDDDGQASENVKYIDEKQMSTVVDWISKIEANVDKFCDYMEIASLDKMPQAKYQQAIEALKERDKK